MVFQVKGKGIYKLRVTDDRGRSATLSTGTDDAETAGEVETFVRWLRRKRKWIVLQALVDKRLPLGRTFDAHEAGTLDDLVETLAAVDLDPLVDEWKKRAIPKYVRQVRRMIPEGQRFPASDFRKATVSAFLAGLDCADPTRNRYRAALSVFAKWLVEREVIETNPVRDVEGFTEHEPRMVWMTWEKAQAVCDAAEEPYRSLLAVVMGTGAEVSTMLVLDRADVDLDAKTVHLGGTKTRWRNRVARIEPWALPYLRRAVQGIVAGPVFPDATEARVRAALKKAQQAVGLSGHRTHDLRHTYAVNALKKGYKPAVVAYQLGHKDATMVTKVYGRYIPDESDYEVPSATSSATTSRKKVRR